jgi:hypothetical protein
LAVDVAADGHGTPDGLDIALLCQNLARLVPAVRQRAVLRAAKEEKGGGNLVTEPLDVCLCELFAVREMRDPVFDLEYVHHVPLRVETTWTAC